MVMLFFRNKKYFCDILIAFDGESVSVLRKLFQQLIILIKERKNKKEIKVLSFF